MRAQFKQFIRDIGLWYFFVHVRQGKAVIDWITKGCPSPPPHIIKLHVVRSYCRRFGLRLFIETGTFLGETTEWMARTGVTVISIELDGQLHQMAKLRLERHANVALIQGDSANVLPEVLRQLDQPACIWLDAHYSGGITAKGASETPIIQELKAIFAHRVGGHVVLVDDARCFEGHDGYPVLEDLLRTIRNAEAYEAEVSTDIIRVTPRRGKYESNSP